MELLHNTVDVSVIVPCYRCADTIERAISSVCEQKAVPAEVILVDDCSGDGTLDVLNALRDRYPPGWIKVISLRVNSGPGSARNEGWKLASSAYIAFLDADDSWHRDKIRLQLQHMLSKPDLVLSGHRSLVVRDSSETRTHVREPLHAWTVLGRHMLLRNRFPTRSVMLRRDVPFRFKDHKRESEDYLLWLTLVLSGYTASRIEEVLAFSYKDDFGDGGLSGNLWRMQRGNIDALASVWRERLISSPILVVCVTWSFIRFFRRAAITGARRIARFCSRQRASPAADQMP